MKLSAPVYALKHQAKVLSKNHDIPLSDALNRIARQEGFATWSLLMSKRDNVLPNHYGEILDFLNAGDLVLVAARPGMGKTTLAFGLVARAIEETRPGNHIFTLAELENDVRKRLEICSNAAFQDDKYCRIDCSDDICANYIIETVQASVESDAIIVVDYLQLLDEKRSNPPLQTQIEQLRQFAKTTGCIMVFVCQLDRRIGDRLDQRPIVEDIRLPNPLDLNLFNKIMLLYRESSQAEKAEVSLVSRTTHHFNIDFDCEHRRFF